MLQLPVKVVTHALTVTELEAASLLEEFCSLT